MHEASCLVSALRRSGGAQPSTLLELRMEAYNLGHARPPSVLLSVGYTRSFST